MSFQLDLEPVTLQPENSQIVLFHQIDDGFDIVELQIDILLVVGCIPPSSLLPGLWRDRGSAFAPLSGDKLTHRS
jgi:hypothetical protein